MILILTKLKIKLIFLISLLGFSTGLLGKGGILGRGGFNVYAGTGIIYYQGDLKETSVPDFYTSHVLGKMGITYNFFNWGELKAQYVFGELSGNDMYTLNAWRGIKFTSPVNEYSVQFKLNLNGFLKKRTWDFYVQGGIGTFTFQPTVTYGTLSSYVPESGFTSPQISYLFAMGITKWLSSHWGVALEGTYRKTNTDYIDGISKNGNPNRNDAFIDVSMVAFYRLNFKKKSDDPRSFPSHCPSF